MRARITSTVEQFTTKTAGARCRCKGRRQLLPDRWSVHAVTAVLGDSSIAVSISIANELSCFIGCLLAAIAIAIATLPTPESPLFSHLFNSYSVCSACRAPFHSALLVTHLRNPRDNVWPRKRRRRQGPPAPNQLHLQASPVARKSFDMAVRAAGHEDRGHHPGMHTGAFCLSKAALGKIVTRGRTVVLTSSITGL